MSLDTPKGYRVVAHIFLDLSGTHQKMMSASITPGPPLLLRLQKKPSA